MWRDEWQQQRCQATPDGQTATGTHYVLVDHAAAPDLLIQLRQRPSLQWASLFEGTMEVNALAAAPILVELGAAADRPGADSLLAWLERTCSWSTAIILLKSRLERAPLAAALARRLDAWLPDDMAVLLRYFDTRVFATLVDVLTAEQRAQFLAVASHWWWIDRKAGLNRISGSGTVADPLAAPIVFDTAQEAALIAASEPDALVQQMQTHAPDLCRDHPRHALHALAATCLPVARTYRIESVVGQALFCLTAMTYGVDFIREAAWAAGLARVASGQLTFETLLRELVV